MTIMGLLQNTWAQNPSRVADMFRRDPEHRNKLIGYLLFMSRCTTSRRLRRTFGSLCDAIVWENASPIIVARPNTKVAGDLDHVQAALDRIKPDVVLAFGRIAGDVMAAAMYEGHIIRGPHPAARFHDLGHRLEQMRRTLESVDVTSPFTKGA